MHTCLESDESLPGATRAYTALTSPVNAVSRLTLIAAVGLTGLVTSGCAGRRGAEGDGTTAAATSEGAGTEAGTTSDADAGADAETGADTGGIGCDEAGGLEVVALGADAPEGFDTVFDREVEVWGLHIFATPATPAEKVSHAAHVMAQYLDNDENCEVDDALVHAKLLERSASLVMFATEAEAESAIEALIEVVPFEVIDQMALQDLYGSETHPDGAAMGVFDASLEEVLHLVSSAGWSEAYPEVFGNNPGTAVTNAMDIARGGYFETVPAQYPEEAWYHYDDVTCDYGCMAVEYFYWALTSHLGGQNFPGRCEEIAVEWEPCSPDEFAATDAAMHGLLTDPSYGLPSVLPDGTYDPSR